jgi:predicted N-acetyltransferase YhbS
VITLRRFETDNAAHHAAAAVIWNAACGPELAITPRAVCFNTLPTTGAVQAGRLATKEHRAVGFVLASAFREGDSAVSPRDLGWVDAIAVIPGFQHRGIGAVMLDWAEDWLAGHECTRFRLGGSLRPFTAGLPTALGAEDFFLRRGYTERTGSRYVWDVARSLRECAPPSDKSSAAISGVRQQQSSEVRPARPGEEGAVEEFLRREFPGRWRFEFQEFLDGGGRISDYLVLLTERGIDGFCQLTFGDSLRPLDRFFMHGLPRPWGQLGPIGVSLGCRGMGHGKRLLIAGLQRLRAAGVDGCVIDWTDLPDFYSKFGFRAYRQYEILVRPRSDG